MSGFPGSGILVLQPRLQVARDILLGANLAMARVLHARGLPTQDEAAFSAFWPGNIEPRGLVLIGEHLAGSWEDAAFTLLSSAKATSGDAAIFAVRVAGHLLLGFKKPTSKSSHLRVAEACRALRFSLPSGASASSDSAAFAAAQVHALRSLVIPLNPKEPS